MLDNLSNASSESLRRVEALTDRTLHFVEGDIRDEALLSELFEKFDIEAVIHFAGLKAVGESVAEPAMYYDVNVHGTLCLVRAMQKAGIEKLVFSSSATVYGEEAAVPYKESMPRGTTTIPYGTSKAMVEQILTDIHHATAATNTPLDVSLLRYFNPIGAHASGQIGEDPQGIPNNLMPYISQVAVGRLKQLAVFGDDYDTPDGSGVRDYIHVVDLAKGHLAALEKMLSHNQAQCAIYNLGSGKGTSVFELIKAFEQANGVKIPFTVAPRRAGDLATCYAAVEKAADELNWRTEKTIEDMVRDTWRWQSNNPNGYKNV